jgi:phosphatidylglycerol:prolipoprotein diacylglycerol transferase
MFPVLLKFGPVKIFTYGFFLALAFLSAIYLSGREARRLGIPTQVFYDLCFYAVLAAIVGSRLLYVLLEWPSFAAHPWKIVALWEGGLVFHGGLVLALAVTIFYMRVHALPWRTTLDALAVGMPVGQFFGRVGCFMAGCCYGSPASLPWAVTFTSPETLCPVKEPLHPAQLYEAFLALGVFGIIYWLRTRKRYEGHLLLTYFFLAGAVRFTVEFFRHPGDYRGPVFFGWMPATQLVALGIALVSGSLLLYFLRRFKRGPQVRARTAP